MMTINIVFPFHVDNSLFVGVGVSGRACGIGGAKFESSDGRSGRVCAADKACAIADHVCRKCTHCKLMVVSILFSSYL